MFLKKSHTAQRYDDFSAELEKNLKQAELAPLAEKNAKQQKAIQHLLKAAEIMDDVGLDRQVNAVTKILERFAWEVPTSDPATSGLTPEKMMSNLENKGWVFNADDGEILDVAEPSPGETVEMSPDGELEITDEASAEDGMAINPMNPINPGAMSSLAHIKNWPRGATDPYGEEQVDLDIRSILKKK